MRLEDEIKSKGFVNEFAKATVNVMFTANWVHGRISCRLKCFGLSQEQFNVLRILLGQHPNAVAQKDILHRMIDRNSNLSRILPKLKAKGLVTIDRSATDRREYEIRLTETALQQLETIQQTLTEASEPMTGLTLSEAFHLNALLDKMREVE